MVSYPVPLVVFYKTCWGPMNRHLYLAIGDVYNLSMYRGGGDRLNPVFMQGTVIQILIDSGLKFEVTEMGFIKYQSSPMASRLDDVLIPIVLMEFGQRALYYHMPNRWTFFELIA